MKQNPSPRFAKSLFCSIAFGLLSIVTGAQGAEADYPLVDAVEFTPRDGLPNFFQKLEDGEPVTIAYLGGSITAQSGWRVQSLEWFREQFPKSKVDQIHAAIGGTGSTLGVFRLENDALNQKPDLLFVEFAVNDAGTPPDRIVKAMEGIVRKTWKASPETDICFVYTMTFRDSKQLANGKMKRSASVMESVADYYGIPSVHMGLEAAKLEKDGKLVMKTTAPMTQVSGDELNESAELATDDEGRIIFSKDGVHPYPETGHVLYTQALIRAMEELRENTEVSPHEIGTPIREDNFEDAQQITITEEMLDGPYENLSEMGDPLAKRFGSRLNPLYRLNPGATLSFRFKGSKAMVYDLLGPDAAVLEITIDGQSKEKTRMDGYCTYSRLSTLGIADGIDDSEHEFTIRVLDEEFDKSQVLFERNRDDIEKSPEKYEPNRWHTGSIFIVGEMVEDPQ